MVVSTKWRNISLVSRFMIYKSNAKSVPYDSVFVVIFISKQCIIKQWLDLVFVISGIIKVSVVVISFAYQPLAWLITLTLDLIILDTTKTSSDNCLLFIHFQENMTYE